MSIHRAQTRIPATYMRGGTSKGVFFKLEDLPLACQTPGPARDALFLRVIGSPDPYGKQIDGMGAGSSSTSKCVILSRSTRPGHDVDYLYGQVTIGEAFDDWSGNCGNLSTVGCTGTELQPEVNGNADLLARFKQIRGRAPCAWG